MFRTILLPVILMGMLGGPVLYSHHQRRSANFNNVHTQMPTQAPWQKAGYRYDSNNVDSVGSRTIPNSGIPYPNVASPSSTSFPPNFASPVASTGQHVPFVQTGQPINSATVTNSPVASYGAIPGFSTEQNQGWNQPGMVPDVARTETFFFRGDANGPDLNSEPLSFTPTIDLSSLFRFDITEQSITSRWDRVSTNPFDQGLHGLRVAVVTGTNSWDLHGSLTYYFDANHRLQRITYRGWTGDATQLLQALQPYRLRPQPTHLAGFYLSKRSGLLIKRPAVIDKSNPVQQLALILEINNPRGNTPLSNDFQSLLPAAKAAQ